jgi:hypothetical protein
VAAPSDVACESVSHWLLMCAADVCC